MKKLISILSSFSLIVSSASIATSCSLFMNKELDLSNQENIKKYSFSNNSSTETIIYALRQVPGLEKISSSDIIITIVSATISAEGSITITATSGSKIVKGEIILTIPRLEKIELPSDGSKISLLEHKDQIITNIEDIQNRNDEEIIKKFYEINKDVFPNEITVNDFYVSNTNENSASITGKQGSEFISSTSSDGLELLFWLNNKTWEENPNYPQNYDGYYYIKDIPDNDYYSTAEGAVGDALKQQLTTIVNTNVNKVSYGEVRYLLIQADSVTDEDGKKYVRGVYDGAHLPNQWYGSGDMAWQREHVWPSSRLGTERPDNKTRNIASDLHNLRAIAGSSGNQSGVNQSKGNLYYGGSSENGKWEKIDLNVFYPGDKDKGDVARIIFYMLVMYPEILNWTNDTNKLNNFQTYSPSGAYMGIKDDLLRWNREDPVDDFEESRNEFIYSGSTIDPNGKTIKAQGNRNPFIDHPEFAHLIWEGKSINELTQ